MSRAPHHPRMMDSSWLKAFASTLSYQNPQTAAVKHKLNEIAMRLDTNYYAKYDAVVNATDAVHTEVIRDGEV
jgi:hypothetical protein